MNVKSRSQLELLAARRDVEHLLPPCTVLKGGLETHILQFTEDYRTHRMCCKLCLK